MMKILDNCMKLCKIKQKNDKEMILFTTTDIVKTEMKENEKGNEDIKIFLYMQFYLFTEMQEKVRKRDLIPIWIRSLWYALSAA